MRDDLGNRGRAYAQAISIHVPRMRDDNLDLLCQELINISIHVPRMRDDFWSEIAGYELKISIHVPRMRDD